MAAMTAQLMDTCSRKERTRDDCMWGRGQIPQYVYQHHQEINILFTDVDEEIDDEVAIDRACATSQNSTWIIICVPGATSKLRNDAQKSVEKRLDRFRLLFPHFERRENSEQPDYIGWDLRYIKDDNTKFYVGGPSIIEDPRFLSELGVLTHKNRCERDGIPFKMFINNFIQIAPLWHMNPSYFEYFQNGSYIVMGDLENPQYSINLTKAIGPEDSMYSPEYDLIEEYKQQQCVLDSNSKYIQFIPTRLAREVAMPYSLMTKLPDTLKIPLLQKAFEQCAGRVPSAKAYANNISVVNHKTILNYCTSEQKEDIFKNGGTNVIPLATRLRITQQLDMFLKGAWGKDTYDLKYRRRLQDIAQAVFLITEVEYKVDGFTGFNAENLVDREVAQERWKAHIERNNSDLTPCYDLLAFIVKQEGYVPDVDEFRMLVAAY
jgi:hypothetical protein